MPDITRTVQVIGLNPDIDQISSERYTQITLGVETISKSPQDQHMMPYTVPRVTGWKYILNLYIPSEKWNNQYKMWQKYDLTIKDTGELILKLNDNTK